MKANELLDEKHLMEYDEDGLEENGLTKELVDKLYYSATAPAKARMTLAEAKAKYQRMLT